MGITIKVEKLKIGMHIDLSQSWIESPFWKNHIEIKSGKDIKKLIKAGIKNVKLDSKRSRADVTNNRVDKSIVNNKKGINAITEINFDTARENIVLNKKGDITVDKQNIAPLDGASDLKKVSSCNEIENLQEDCDSTKNIKGKTEYTISHELAQAFNDKSLPPKARAKVVYKYSREMMKNVLESPTAEVIGTAKAGISQVVDTIIKEDATSTYLMRLVAHDFYTYTHSVNVGVKSILLTKAFYNRTDKHNMDELGSGFFLHDIGKVNVDLSIVNKPGKLTEEEMDDIRKHPEFGYLILNNTKHLSTEAWIIVMQHHERPDGKGYPRSLTKNDIHPYASICCIADVYDALTGKRSYKKESTPVEALKIMAKEMANNFNKELFGKFFVLFKQTNIRSW